MRQHLPVVLFSIALCFLLFTFTGQRQAWTHLKWKSKVEATASKKSSTETTTPGSTSSPSTLPDLSSGQGAPPPEAVVEAVPTLSVQASPTYNYTKPVDQKIAQQVDESFKQYAKSLRQVQEAAPAAAPAPKSLGVGQGPYARPSIAPRPSENLSANVAPEQLKVVPEPIKVAVAAEQDLDAESLKKFWGSIAISAILLFCSIFVILSKSYPDASNKWAYATIGTLLVYWLK